MSSFIRGFIYKMATILSKPIEFSGDLKSDLVWISRYSKAFKKSEFKKFPDQNCQISDSLCFGLG